MLMMFLDAKDGTKTVSGYPKWMTILAMIIRSQIMTIILNLDR